MTHDEIVEYIKCAKDPLYCLENYVWLNADEGVMQFNVGQNFGDDYFYQRQVIEWLGGGKSVAVLKNRRAGISWSGAFWAWWLANFHRGYDSLLISIGQREATSLLKKVKFIHNNLYYKDHKNIELCRPAKFLQALVTVDNQQNFVLGHRDETGQTNSESAIKSLPSTENTGRGEGTRFVFIDEACFIENQEDLLSSVLTTAARAGNYLMGSSAGDVGTTFYNMCIKGRNKLDDKRWTDVGSYIYREVWPDETAITEDMIKKSSEVLSEEKIKREWYLEFVQSGDAVFNSVDLAACYKPPFLYPEIQKTIDEYRLKVRNGKGQYYYYSGIDNAVGKVKRKSKQKDYNAAVVFSMTGIQIHAETNQKPLSHWAGKTIEDENGNNIAVDGRVSNIHKEFPGLMQIEEDGPGYTVINRHVLPNDGISRIRTVATRQQTKTRMVNAFQLAVEAHKVIITHTETYNQLLAYQHGESPGTFEAPEGQNDDLVMASIIGWDNLLYEGGYELEFYNSAKLEDLQIEPNQDELLDLQQYALPTASYKEGVRDPISLPFEQEIFLDERFLPNEDLMKKMRKNYGFDN